MHIGVASAPVAIGCGGVSAGVVCEHRGQPGRPPTGLTDDTLRRDTEPVAGPGWPESRGYPVSECLLTIFNEEWEHRLYAERDLDALEVRGA